MAAGGATEEVDPKDGASDHAHRMIVDECCEFNTGAEDHFVFS